MTRLALWCGLTRADATTSAITLTVIAVLAATGVIHPA